MKELYAIRDGEPMLTTAGMSVLFGLTVHEIQEASRRHGASERFPIPADWLRRGRRRAKEAQAATGQTDVLTALRYWYEKEGVR